MKRRIYYHQMMPIEYNEEDYEIKYDEEGTRIWWNSGDYPLKYKRVELQVESSSDHEFEEQIAAVNTYCGGDYTVEELEDVPDEITQLELAAAELYERMEELENG